MENFRFVSMFERTHRFFKRYSDVIVISQAFNLSSRAVNINDLIVEQLAYLRSALALKMSKSLQACLPIEDMVQDTYIKALEASKNFEFRGEASLRQWLLTIAWNHILSKIRKQGPQFGETAQNLIESGVFRPSEIVSKAEQIKRLKSALEQLPVHYQEILTMRYVLGQSFEEIAEVLKKSAAAVRGLHRNAIQKLKAIFRVTVYV